MGLLCAALQSRAYLVGLKETSQLQALEHQDEDVKEHQDVKQGQREG